ncbi:nuclear transport factor 2 family protein [Paenibacillus sp. LMG 31458]|uniref:Nuclear transport factor 2 family protein n=1 Tax=Paenibacillus phytorum TaxID=2654977 RepID=A0ABX1XTJ8_9BACL|nr:nuclear transport factor 2 family protein [Paenibacillus phytorum]NOU71838.1 nuclear transport factor 2 family protein [Paenibacillus phytorum]
MMHEVNEKIAALAAAYNAVWNEPDVSLRRKAVEELWTEEAIHCTDTSEEKGHDAIESRIVEAYDKFVDQGSFAFKPLNNVSHHHGAIRLGWVMVPSGGGKVLGAGTVFILLGKDGRITRDYQFTDEV